MVPDYVRKYPRTPHLPWSPGSTSDDKWLSTGALEEMKSGVELVVTEKMDGGNLTMYRDFFHARSLDSGTQPWGQAAKALWSRVRFDIPEGWRVSGESLYARRSVSYESLPGVFMVFGIWDEQNMLLSWDEMAEFAELLDLPVVPLLYRGSDFDAACAAWSEQRDVSMSEGFVVRHAGEIAYGDFGSKVGKWVRANHVQTAADWRHRDDFDVNGFAGAE